MSIRPSNEDYYPYFDTYVRLVPEGHIKDTLRGSLSNTVEFLLNITEDQAHYRYAPEKWSLKEVLGHVIDNERIMSYRLLRVARGDKTPLAGYDEDALVQGASFDTCAWSVLMEDYAAVRRATITLLEGVSEEAYARKGVVNGKETSAIAIAYIIAGHELHHLNVIKERYINE